MNYNTDINWDLFFSQVDLIYDDKPLLIKNFIPNPESLASWKDVEKSLNGYELGWEIIENSKKINIPTLNIRWKNGGYFDKEFIYNNINQGKTFQITRYSTQNNYIRKICSEIETLFPVTTDAHLYGSKGNNSSSFPYHYDRPTNFIIQTYGECKWEVYSNTISLLFQEDFPRLDPTKLTPIIQTTLTPGDLLYIPSRFHHAAFPNQPRLSVSIPCFPGTVGRWDKTIYKL
jgi:ribosomal protein L16 Arg81 hydroxylase